MVLTYALEGARDELLSRVHLAGHGTGVLASERLEGLEIWVPALNEQRRIAGVLNALDDLIDTNERIIAALWDSAKAVHVDHRSRVTKVGCWATRSPSSTARLSQRETASRAHSPW
ncbi:hypothetical protein GS575_12055 [Rhodococcus hoagii]|nr:hypothetical protein [Prescottella equi]